MKVCTKCGQEKPKGEYFWKDKAKNRLHAQCKTCYREHRQTYQAMHYAQYRESYLERARARRNLLKAEYRNNMLAYMSKKCCFDCGESDIRVLELDHIEPSEKSFNISQAVRLGKSWVEVESELQKCRVLCANCHKKRTAQQFGWYKAI